MEEHLKAQNVFDSRATIVNRVFFALARIIGFYISPNCKFKDEDSKC